MDTLTVEQLRDWCRANDTEAKVSPGGAIAVRDNAGPWRHMTVETLTETILGSQSDPPKGPRMSAPGFRATVHFPPDDDTDKLPRLRAAAARALDETKWAWRLIDDDPLEVLPEALVAIARAHDGSPVDWAPGYATLSAVLNRAFAQAANGKGRDRHSRGQAFESQPMQTLCQLYGVGFALGQAAKKTQEAQRLPLEPAVAELLGAINYIAGAVIHMEHTAAANDNREPHSKDAGHVQLRNPDNQG